MTRPTICETCPRYFKECFDMIADDETTLCPVKDDKERAIEVAEKVINE